MCDESRSFFKATRKTMTGAEFAQKGQNDQKLNNHHYSTGLCATSDIYFEFTQVQRCFYEYF